MSKIDVFNQFPILDVDKEIRLREIRDTDARSFFNYVSEPEVKRFISEEDVPNSYEAAIDELRYWADLFTYRRSIYWAIVRKDTNIIIGTCGFNVWSLTHNRVEISYDLSKAYWNKGITTRCLQTILHFAFDKMEVNRVQATVSEVNAPSIRVLEKLNFQREGLLKQYGCLHGEYHDFYMYGLLKEHR